MPKKPNKKVRPALPSGFRDFGPAEVYRRRRLFRLLAELFERYGYQPLETPAVELLSVLLGKYGEEGDKLLFRILNSGDFLAEVPEEARADSHTLLPYITEKALRYDLTVPMARWVAQHAGELVFPFKRYQIQPVWRADRPQRGRFREFYQCDIDIVGAEGIMPLLEIVAIIQEALQKLGLSGAVLHLNHRSLLEKAAQEAGWPESDFAGFCSLLDKADKIGWEAVEEAFGARGIRLPAWLHPTQGLPPLSDLPEIARDAEALQQLLDTPAFVTVRWDSTLARGLEYYTGYVYELRVPGSGVGSIGAGGAYASLVHDFGGPDLPAMGFSFGVERILTILENTQNGFAAEGSQPVLVAWVDASPGYIQEVVQQLHQAGQAAFAYPAPKKLSRQIEYAQRRGLPWVVIVGRTEETTRTVQRKNLLSHTQETLSLHALAEADWV